MSFISSRKMAVVLIFTWYRFRFMLWLRAEGWGLLLRAAPEPLPASLYMSVTLMLEVSMRFFFLCENEMSYIDTFVMEKCVTDLKPHPEINSFITIYLVLLKVALIW